MGWLANLLFPCSQARKSSRESSLRSRSQSSLQEYQRHAPSFIDTALLPQKPNRLARKPSSHEASSIRIVEYPDEESMLDETRATDEKNQQVGIACTDTSSVLSDDRTILMPEPDEEALRVEMRKIEKDLTALPTATTTTSTTAPRRTSWTTTRTSACLDMGPADVLGRITEAIEEEQESEESSSPEPQCYEGPFANAGLSIKKEGQGQVHPEPQEQQPQDQIKQAPEANKQEKDHHHSTRVSQRPSLIEIFDLLRTSQRTSYKLNLDFSPKFYSSPFSPASPSSSTTAFSPPMSPASSMLPLSPTLSDDTIKINGIETACAVQIAGRKGPEEIVDQAKATQDAFGFRWD